MSDPRSKAGYFSDDPQLRGGVLIGRWWLPTWLLVLLASMIVLGFTAKPAYRAWRTWRLDDCLAAAQQAAACNEWDTVRDKAHSVLLARPGDVAAYRLWARALGKLEDPRTYLVAAGLFSSPRASRDDRLEALRVMANQAPQTLALSAYASLPDASRDDSSFRAAITPLLVQLGESPLAEARLREVIRPGDDASVQLEMLRTLCQNPTPDRLHEARAIFAKLISGKSDTAALAALLLLSEVPGGLAPGAPLPDLAEWLDSQARASAVHHLRVMEPALDARPDAAPAVYESAIARFLASDPGVLGTWLIRHQQSATAARILEGPATTRADAWLARISALLAMRDESAAEAALAEVPAAVNAVDAELAQAKLEWLRDKPQVADAALTRAMNRAALDGSRNRFIEIARLADAHGARESAENAWVAAIRMGWGPLPPYSKLLALFAALAAKDRSEDMLAMYRALLRLEPRNPELLNHFHYLALIHGLLPPSEVIPAQAKLVAAYPDTAAFNATLMLAEMSAGSPTDALAHLPSLRTSSRVTPMMKTALEGSARVLVGDTAAGTALLAKVNWLDFMRQERSVFRRMLLAHQLTGLALPEPVPTSATTGPDAIPAWRKALERLEKDHAGDVLPALPAPRIPGGGPPDDP
ncbi:MAG: hypothetical protein WCP35_15020 [Verrucomicrobiota bacterium]